MTLQSMWEKLKGKKTYFVAAGMIAYALLGVELKQHDWHTAAILIFNALGMAGIRNGFTTTIEKSLERK